MPLELRQSNAAVGTTPQRTLLTCPRLKQLLPALQANPAGARQLHDAELAHHLLDGGALQRARTTSSTLGEGPSKATGTLVHTKGSSP